MITCYNSLLVSYFIVAKFTIYGGDANVIPVNSTFIIETSDGKKEIVKILHQKSANKFIEIQHNHQITKEPKFAETPDQTENGNFFDQEFSDFEDLLNGEAESTGNKMAPITNADPPDSSNSQKPSLNWNYVIMSTNTDDLPQPKTGFFLNQNQSQPQSRHRDAISMKVSRSGEKTDKTVRSEKQRLDSQRGQADNDRLDEKSTNQLNLDNQTLKWNYIVMAEEKKDITKTRESGKNITPPVSNAETTPTNDTAFVEIKIQEPEISKRQSWKAVNGATSSLSNQIPQDQRMTRSRLDE